ncbi:MmgE/PrpD family protein [compost metagenome]
MPKGNDSRESEADDAEHGVAWLLAERAIGLSLNDIDATTRESVWRCVLDVLTSAAAAQGLPGLRAAQHAAGVLYGTGHSPIWFTGHSGSTGGAMFANSAAAAALDLDDGYRMARGHPGAAIIPAALAIAGERRQVDVHEFVCAVVAGYEVALRLAMARPAYAPSGAWSGYGVVVAAGRLLGASARTVAQALGIVAQTAPGLPALAGIAGSDVKEGIPAGVAAGWAALQLAMAGFAGPVSVLDDPALFDRSVALGGLAGSTLITGTYFKPFGCCRHIHAPVEALLHLKAVHGFAASEIAAVRVHTYWATFNLSNLPRPRTLVQAQYSTPYCVALSAVHGHDALVPLRAGYIDDAKVAALAERVRVLHEPDIEPLFPERSPARVTVILNDGRTLDSGVMDARGDPAMPLTWEDLERKLRVATRGILATDKQQALLDGMTALRKGVWGPLLHVLHGAGGAP